MTGKRKEWEEAQRDPFLPGGVLSDPRVDRITALRRELDEVLVRPEALGRGAAADEEARRYKMAKLLTQLTARGPLQQSAFPTALPSVPPSEDEGEDDDHKEEEEEEDAEEVIGPVAKALPKGVPDWAKALLNIILRSPGGILGWDSASGQLITRGVPIPGTNIADLVTHVTQERLPRKTKRGSPGPPPGFDSFARGLRGIECPQGTYQESATLLKKYIQLREGGDA